MMKNCFYRRNYILILVVLVDYFSISNIRQIIRNSVAKSSIIFYDNNNYNITSLKKKQYK